MFGLSGNLTVDQPLVLEAFKDGPDEGVVVHNHLELLLQLSVQLQKLVHLEDGEEVCRQNVACILLLKRFQGFEDFGDEAVVEVDHLVHSEVQVCQRFFIFHDVLPILAFLLVVVDLVHLVLVLLFFGLVAKNRCFARALKRANIPISLLDLFRHPGQAGEDDVEVGKCLENLTSVFSPEQVGQLEFLLDVAEEGADVLLLEGGDVVRPVDDPLQDLSRGDEPDHPAELRPVLQVRVQLVLIRDLTETWNLRHRK